MSVIRSREEAVDIAETAEAIEIAGVSKNSKKSKDSNYPGNSTLVLYIQYPIVFRKKSMPVTTLLNLSNEINAIHPTFAQGFLLCQWMLECEKLMGTR